jgi:hypothetical protein
LEYRYWILRQVARVVVEVWKLLLGQVELQDLQLMSLLVEISLTLIPSAVWHRKISNVTG